MLGVGWGGCCGKMLNTVCYAAPKLILSTAGRCWVILYTEVRFKHLVILSMWNGRAAILFSAESWAPKWIYYRWSWLGLFQHSEGRVLRFKWKLHRPTCPTIAWWQHGWHIPHPDTYNIKNDVPKLGQGCARKLDVMGELFAPLALEECLVQMSLPV